MEPSKGGGRPKPPTRPKPSGLLASSQNKGERPPLPKRPPVGTVQSSDATKAPVAKVPPPLPQLPPSGGTTPTTPDIVDTVTPGGGLVHNHKMAPDGTVPNNVDSKTDNVDDQIIEDNMEVDVNDNSQDKSVMEIEKSSTEERPIPVKKPRPTVKPRPTPAKRKSLDKQLSKDLNAQFEMDITDNAESDSVKIDTEKGDVKNSSDVKQDEVIDASQNEVDKSLSVEVDNKPDNNGNNSDQPVKPPRPNKARKSIANNLEDSAESVHKVGKSSPSASRKISQPSVVSPKLSQKLKSVAQNTDKDVVEKSNDEPERPKSLILRPAPPPPKKKKVPTAPLR